LRRGLVGEPFFFLSLFPCSPPARGKIVSDLKPSGISCDHFFFFLGRRPASHTTKRHQLSTRPVVATPIFPLSLFLFPLQMRSFLGMKASWVGGNPCLFLFFPPPFPPPAAEKTRRALSGHDWDFPPPPLSSFPAIKLVWRPDS